MNPVLVICKSAKPSVSYLRLVGKERSENGSDEKNIMHRITEDTLYDSNGKVKDKTDML